MTQTGLIYDVGAHNGDDTAWYLQQGYRVVAVEANPLLVKELEKKFSPAIETGKLKVVNVAVTEKDGETIPFFISRDDWRSSTQKKIAEREADIVQTVQLPTATLAALFQQYGCPQYCKIDIEGNDAVAINSLKGTAQKPQYISCEISCHSIAEVQQNEALLYETLNALQQAGYKFFQLMDQDSLLQLSDNIHYSRQHTFSARLRTKWERITGRYTARHSNRYLVAKNRKTTIDYVTTPFGEALTGNWTDVAATRALVQLHFNDYYKNTQNKELIFWVDIHARL